MNSIAGATPAVGCTVESAAAARVQLLPLPLVLVMHQVQGHGSLHDCHRGRQVGAWVWLRLWEQRAHVAGRCSSTQGLALMLCMVTAER
jgi:hypothetical protein